MSALVVLLTTVMVVLLRVPQIFLAPFINCLVRLLDAWPLAPMDHLHGSSTYGDYTQSNKV